MPAIITDQFRILNAETFAQSFTGIGTTTNYYYTFLGHPNPTNVSIGDYGDTEWGSTNKTPAPRDSFKQENLYHDSMLFLKRVTASDVRRVVRRYNWELGITYDMYKNNYDINNKSPQTASSTLYGSKFFIVNSEFKVYACLNNGANPEFPKGQKSLAEPNFVDVTPQPAGTGSDGYLWKYLYTISPSDVVKFATDSYIPLPDKWGDTATSTVKNAAVKGKIETVLITARGSAYSITGTSGSGSGTGTITNIPIFGDGSGGFVSVTLNGGEVDTITVTNGGKDYTKAFLRFESSLISNLSAGSGATFEVIIPPQDGHGADVYRELGGNRVMIYSKYDADPDYVIGNNFARVGLIKNPVQFGSATESLDTSTATALGALKLKIAGAATTTSGTTYPINAKITQTISSVGVGSTAVGYVASWNGDTGILRYYQPVGLSTLSAAGSKLLDFAGISTAINCDDSDFSGTTLIVDTDFDNKNSINSGSSIIELGQTFNDGIAPPDFNRHSGEVIYIDNRAPITRSSSQKEEVKIVVEF